MSALTASRSRARTGLGAWLPWVACACALLRLVHLGEWSLWIDEAFTFHDARRGQGFVNPLGYELYRWYLLVCSPRPDELALRLPSAVLGMLGVPLTWWAFRPAAGPLVAGAASLLLALSSWHVYWSQTARFYTLAQDLALLGCGLYLRGLWSGRGWRAASGIAVVCVGALAHPSTAGLLPALLLAPYFVRGLVPGARAFGGAALRAALALGLVGLLPGAWWAWDIFSSWDQIKGEGNPAHFLLSIGFHVSPLYAAGALAGAFIAARRRETCALLALLVCVLYLGCALIVACFARVSAQYAFVLLPWLCLLAAMPLAAVPLGAQREEPGSPAGLSASKWAYLGVLALPSLIIVCLHLSERQGERPQWKAAYRYVFEHRRPGDMILGMEAPVGEYYLGDVDADLRKPRDVVWLDSWRAAVPGQWSRFPRRMWFVINPEQLKDWADREMKDELLELLRTDCRLQAAWPLYVESRDLSVWVYLREP